MCVFYSKIILFLVLNVIRVNDQINIFYKKTFTQKICLGSYVQSAIMNNPGSTKF